MSLENEYQYPNYLNFIEAIKVCFSKYGDFTGRAPRSEYWWFVFLWWVIDLPIFLIIFYFGVHFDDPTKYKTLYTLIYLMTRVPLFIPGLAVQARRLHDLNMSGKWQLTILIPFFQILILIGCLFKGESQKNRFDQAIVNISE